MAWLVKETFRSRTGKTERYHGPHDKTAEGAYDASTLVGYKSKAFADRVMNRMKQETEADNANAIDRYGFELVEI